MRADPGVNQQAWKTTQRHDDDVWRQRKFVKYQPILTVAIVATAIFVYMEFVNWWAFKWVLSWDRLESLRSNKWVRWGLKHFSRSPYLMVFFFAATPIPFWVARSLAVLHKLSLAPYIVVMALGRFPRLLIYAWIGAQLQVPTFILISLAIGTGLALILWRLLKREPILKDSVLDG